MRPVVQSRSLVAGVVGAVCASQTLGGAGNLLINGSLASGGVATLASQQYIGITSTGAFAGTTFTITGTDDQGRFITENLAGPSNSTVNSVFSYLTVTSIKSSTALGTAVTVDTVTAGAGREIPTDVYLNPGNTNISVQLVSGAVNYTVQWTLDDVFGGAPGPFNWYNAAGNVVGASTTQAASITSPIRAVRMVTNSGTGVVKLTVMQTGATG